MPAELQEQIEQRLSHSEPQVEVLLAEAMPNDTLRVFIDHPDGVTLGLCERVSGLLSDLRERYSLEISSPGAQRPLTKPSHFRRYVGHRARVRTLRPLADWRPPRSTTGARGCAPGEQSAPDGGEGRSVRSITGELMGATDSEITLAAEGGVVAIPYSEIRRSNLVEE
jgi:ribosome maturation factor RimP